LYNIKESIENNYNGFISQSNYLNSTVARELEMLTNITNLINLFQSLMAQDLMERNQVLNELLARPLIDYEEDLKTIDSKNSMQLEIIKTTNSKIVEIKEDVHMVIKIRTKKVIF
jgi:Tfp pilus assembly ATPase PilU